MTAQLHPSAMIGRSARLAPSVQVGPYAVIGDEVELGEGCIVHAHATIGGPSRFGCKNIFHPHSVIGGDPQDITYRGERVELAVGNGNIFREYVTVSRGTVKGGGTTRIGDENLFLASSHVGHDCQIGSKTLFVNGATLAGHVIVEDFATIGAFSPVHQFCRIGRHAYVGAATVITQDVLPFSLVVTERETKTFGVNVIGLERKGFSNDRVNTLQRAFRLLTRSKMNTTQAIGEMHKEFRDSEDVGALIQFIETAKRGIVK